jgi:hypothetical protein
MDAIHIYIYIYIYIYVQQYICNNIYVYIYVQQNKTRCDDFPLLKTQNSKFRKLKLNFVTAAEGVTTRNSEGIESKGRGYTGS